MKPRIIYFAPTDWNSIFQRPHHLAKRLSSFFDFYYIQPLGLRSFKMSDYFRAIKRLHSLFNSTISGQSLHIKNFLFIPFQTKLALLFNKKLIKLQISTLINKKTLLWITAPSPVLKPVLQALDYNNIVYEMLDDYEDIHPKYAKKIRECEQWLIKNSRFVIVTSKELYKKAEKYDKRKTILLISNGVEYDYFNTSTSEIPDDMKGINNVAGYIGAIDKWMDFEALAFLSKTLPHINFVFVGPIRIKNVPMAKNIYYLGQKDYKLIPRYCKNFSVCLIPFKITEFADTINPLKLYEYFSLGKPVVSFRMKELLKYKDIIYLSNSKEEFAQNILIAFNEKNNKKQMTRKKIAKANDWDIKAGLIKKHLLELFSL